MKIYQASLLLFLFSFILSSTSVDVTEPSVSELSALRKEALKYHNILRAKHKDTPSAELNEDLNDFAQNHCVSLAESGYLQHSSSSERTNIGKLSGYSGENLFWSSRKSFDGLGQMASQNWYNEIDDYDLEENNAINGATVGHFTQMVWKTSVKVGFGFAYSNKGTFVCANYYPGGNVNVPGNYKYYVMPLKTDSETSEETGENNDDYETGSDASKNNKDEIILESSGRLNLGVFMLIIILLL